jgi:hypothetical protein
MNSLLDVYYQDPKYLGSPQMVSLFEALAKIPFEQRVAYPKLGGISITVDEFIISGHHFLGSACDLENNLAGLCDHFGIDRSEVKELMKNADDWRRGGNAWDK